MRMIRVTRSDGTIADYVAYMSADELEGGWDRGEAKVGDEIFYRGMICLLMERETGQMIAMEGINMMQVAGTFQAF